MGSAELYVGTSGFAYASWRGKFYPEKLPQREMLRFYATQFSTVEINHTFYTPPEAPVLRQWAADVPAGFQFALKINNQITHIRRLRDCSSALHQFLKASAVLGEENHLGPILVQLPPNFKTDIGLLEKFLKLCPREFRFTFEFRHASWLTEETYALLRQNKMALCLAETDEDAPPLVQTADFIYARLRRKTYQQKRLAVWKQRYDSWRNMGAEVFAYFKHEDTGTAPRYARKLLSL
ncbi:MAG: DUF72 domain-containing protein [Acidobacteria bacterium]|nr:DUF72 domain-containing protein [Acidobacteriota bacterium]